MMKKSIFLIMILQICSVSAYSGHHFPDYQHTTYPINTPFSRTFKVYCRAPYRIQKEASGVLWEWDFWKHDKVADMKFEFHKAPRTGEYYALVNVATNGTDDGEFEKDLELYYEFSDVCYQKERFYHSNVFLDEYDVTPQCIFSFLCPDPEPSTLD